MASLKQYILDQIRVSYETKKLIYEDKKLIDLIEEVGRACLKAYQQGNKLIIAGNGGSAADAQHIAGELVGQFYQKRPALPAIAITTNTSNLTAIGNDFSFDEVFSRQLEAHGVPGDVFLSLSTSGNSKNIIQAIKSSKMKKILTIGLTGADGGTMAEHCDYCIKVPSKETPRIQESHILVGHILCSIIERGLFGEGF